MNKPQNSKILNTILAYQITTKTLVFNTKKYKQFLYQKNIIRNIKRYIKNYKTLTKEAEEDTNKWKDLSCYRRKELTLKNVHTIQRNTYISLTTKLYT